MATTRKEAPLRLPPAHTFSCALPLAGYLQTDIVETRETSNPLVRIANKTDLSAISDSGKLLVWAGKCTPHSEGKKKWQENP